MDSQSYTKVKNAIQQLFDSTTKSQQQQTDAGTKADLEARVIFISSLFPETGTTTMDIHLKAMIGMEICRVIEELSPNRNSNPNAKKLIIPVGIPGSGKSSLVELYQDEHTLKLDADYMREQIFNSVFAFFYNGETIDFSNPNQKIKDIYKPMIIDKVKNLVNFGIFEDKKIEEVKSLFDDEKTNKYCQGGTEGYCHSKVFFAENAKDNKKQAELFLPSAFDICLLYCKEFNKNFIYDSPNCELHFRNNLMIRANRIGDFKEAVISVLLPDLSKIEEQLINRNQSGIRETPIPINNFNEYFKIADTQTTELQIHEVIKKKLHNKARLEKAAKEAKAAAKETKADAEKAAAKAAEKAVKAAAEDIYYYYKDKYNILSYDLYTLFKYLYESLGASQAYGSPKISEYDIKDFNIFEGKIKLEFKIFTANTDTEGKKILKKYVPPYTPPVSGEHTKSHDVYGKKFREETKFGPFDNAGGKKTKKRKSNKIKTKRKKGKRKMIRPTKTKRKRRTKRR